MIRSPHRRLYNHIIYLVSKQQSATALGTKCNPVAANVSVCNFPQKHERISTYRNRPSIRLSPSLFLCRMSKNNYISYFSPGPSETSRRYTTIQLRGTSVIQDGAGDQQNIRAAKRKSFLPPVSGATSGGGVRCYRVYRKPFTSSDGINSSNLCAHLRLYEIQEHIPASLFMNLLIPPSLRESCTLITDHGLQCALSENSHH